MSGPWIDLTGKVAVVTGAASGIGRAAAVALAGAGATVVALDRALAGAKTVAAEIKGVARALDVVDEAQWQAIGDWIEADFGRLDILVNSAGVALKDSVGDATLEIYRRTFAINVEGSLLGMAMALRFMQKTGKGAIVNLSSTASLKANPIMASYGASKATVAHFTRSAAVKAIRDGHEIRINAVQPGLIETPMAEDLYSIMQKIGSPDAVRAVVTSGRSGTPEEVADLILFLCSDRASYISGAAIVIDRAASA